MLRQHAHCSLGVCGGGNLPEPAPACCQVAAKRSPHSSAVTYQIGHQRITWELSVSVGQPRRFYCSGVSLPLLSPSRLAPSNEGLRFDLAPSPTFRLIWNSFIEQNLAGVSAWLPAPRWAARTSRHSSSKSSFHTCKFPLNSLFRAPTCGLFVRFTLNSRNLRRVRQVVTQQPFP